MNRFKRWARHTIDIGPEMDDQIFDIVDELNNHGIRPIEGSHYDFSKFVREACAYHLGHCRDKLTEVKNESDKQD